MDPCRPSRDGAGGLRRRELGADRDVAPVAGGVLRRGRARRRRRLSAHARHDDPRPGPRGAGMGLGRAARARRRSTGRRSAIGSPDLIMAAVELEGGAVVRLTASFYVGRPVHGGARSSSTAMPARSRSGSFQEFGATVEAGRRTATTRRSRTSGRRSRASPGPAGWPRWPTAIAAGRPHRASAEQAAHVVDILDAARRSIASDGRPVEVASTFVRPELMPWATGAVGGRVVSRPSYSGAGSMGRPVHPREVRVRGQASDD